jgi:hypothetical protein
MGSHYKPEFTSLEKMGFVMGGLGNPLVEHARETAMNTRRTAELLERQSGGHAAATGALIHQPI